MSLPRQRNQHRDRARPIRLFLVVGLLGALCLGVPTSGPAVAATAADCAVPGVDDKCEAWVSTYRSGDTPYDVVVGAGGRRIFATGVGSTVAFDDAGNQLWDAPIPGKYGAGYAVAASPDGLRLYVAYFSVEDGVNKSGTIAHDARTGRLLWAASSPTGEFGGADVAVTPDGERVVVLSLSCTGGGPESACPSLDYSYVTSSLAATTGARQWTSHYESGKQATGQPVDHDAPRELILSRDGTRTFVTGLSATVAYDTASGATLWANRENPGEFFGIAASPDGSLVFVAGHGAQDSGWLGSSVTLAYNAATGTKVWAARLPVPAEPPGAPGSMAGFTPWPCCGNGPLQISPTGDRLYLTGQAAYYTAWPDRRDYDALTLAYDPSSGRVIWQGRYRGAAPNPGIDHSTDERGFFLQVAPDGSRVYMAGLSYNPTDYLMDNGPRDYATVAYDAADGAQQWVARYNSSAAAIDTSVPLGGLAISPDGTRLYALGSLGGSHNHITPSGERAWGLAAYDTGAGRPAEPRAWSSAGSTLAPRVSHTATALGDGRVLVTGGCSTVDHQSEDVPCPAHTSSAEVYRPPVAPATGGSWSPVAPMSAPRSNHTSTLLPGGQVLVVGGCALPTDTVLCPASPTAEQFDSIAGAFTPVAPMAAPRVHHSATLLDDGMVLVAGGADAGEVSASAEVYDPVSGWSITGSLNQPRYGHTATLLPNRKILVTGGADAAGRPLGTAELYDPNTGAWTSTGSLATPRYAHTATVLATGKVLLLGGCVAATEAASCPASVYAELFDPVAGTSTPTGSLEVARAMPAASVLADGRVLVAGGRGHSGDSLSSAELFDPATATWSLTDAMLEARAGGAFDLRGHTANALADGRILVVGGTPATTTEVYAPPAVVEATNAELSLTMTDSPDPVRVGQRLTYTIPVANAGPATASDLSLRDDLPAAVKLVSASATQGSCATSGQTVTCSSGALAPGSGLTVSIVVRPNATGVLTNTATVSAATPDLDLNDNTASASTTVRR